MDAMDLYRSNLAKMGLDQPITEEQPAQPARRTVEPQQPTVAPVRPLQPESSEDHIQQLERFAANAQERLYKVEHTGVLDPRIDELEARVKVLENLLKPVVAEKPMGEIDRIAVEYASLEGKTELTYHQFRCLARTARQALLREATHV